MLTLDGVKVTFKDKTALDLGRMVEIADNDRVGVIGSNGAGKTTLIKSILGIVNYQGNIKRGIGVDKIAVHMQQNEYIDTVPLSIILEMLIGGPIKENKKIMEMIEFFEFESCLKKRWKHLSGGQKQRFTLILVMCSESPLTLLDEVTSGLDFETRQKLMKKLTQWYKERNTTLLVTSHYYEELEHLVNKILYLDKGKVVDFGNKDELFRKYCGKAVILCEENDAVKEILKNHRQIIAPEGMIALRCDEKEDEIAVSEALSGINVNYRRSNNDIELMTINAKAVYYGGGER
jgi:hypothetical protein